ncbi:beta/alpha barrel domain-containing protein [Helicobacter mesocricetorum]|uniref:hypothetical protein n=1 Tax=Helicobacter mesocricetorum TaxID=87012 RepID=UPI000CF1415F|nr:hypothetical protein [Helicobacter mesocricetorum]
MEFDLTALQKQIAQKKQSYPQEWLGRSLAYTPYQPRPISETLRKTKTFTPKNLYRVLDTKDFLEIAIHKAQNHSALVIDSLENLTYIRRYVNLPLIFDTPIIDTYQILESLVYGADSLCLRPHILSQKDLKICNDFSAKLGLESIFYIYSKEDLTKAIFAGANILIVDNIELIPLIPNHKIILSTTSTHKGIDSLILRD